MTNLENPRDVCKLIKGYIEEINSDGELPIKNPGSIAQLLNIFLRAWELNNNTEMEKRLEKVEKQLQEKGNNYERREMVIEYA